MFHRLIVDAVIVVVSKQLVMWSAELLADDASCDVVSEAEWVIGSGFEGVIEVSCCK
jgi:hypothetical protein